MHVYLAGRHVELTDALRLYVENHLVQPIRDHNALNVTHVEIQLFAEGDKGNHFGCHILVEVSGHHEINVRELQDDLYAAIDLTKDRTVRCLSELRDRMLSIRRRPTVSLTRLGRALGWIRRNRTNRYA